MDFTKLYVADIMAKYRYTEAEAKAFIWGVKKSGAPEIYEALKSLSLGDIDPTYRQIIIKILAKVEGKKP